MNLDIIEELINQNKVINLLTIEQYVFQMIANAAFVNNNREETIEFVETAIGILKVCLFDIIFVILFFMF